MILLRPVSNVVEIRDGWKEAVYCSGWRNGQYIHPSLISTTLGTYFRRIMIDSLMTF
jgi:hypothetical protein